MNESTLVMSFNSIITIGITSGFFAGIVSVIGSIFIALFNNRSERKKYIEEYRYTINDYRYKELHKYLKVVCDLPSKNYMAEGKEKLMELVLSSNKEDEKVMSIYRRAYPLLDNDYLGALVSQREKVEQISHGLIKQVFTECDKQFGVDRLIIERDKFKELLVDALQKQLISLLSIGRKQNKFQR